MSEQRDIILRLKSIRDEKGLSQQNIIDLAGYSKSTISRLFQDGSENGSFRMDTLKSDEKSLTDEKSVQLEKIKSLEEKHEKEMSELKDVISNLRLRLDQNEKEIQSIMGQMSQIITELNSQINFKSEQIKIKDARMDQKDKRYDALFAEFIKLTNRCENCNMRK